MTPKFDKLNEGLMDNIKPIALAGAMAIGPGDAEAGGAARGIRNHNPGNIKKGQSWTGEVEKGTDKTFEQFKSADYGIRAIGITLRTYHNKHGLDTVNDIISRWAPPSENKTKNYINFVSKQLGVKSTDKLKLFKGKVINNRVALKALIVAIIRMENSYAYPDSTIERGLNLITPAKARGQYVVIAGDNLSAIAAKHKTSVKGLAAANPQIKDINKIFPGQKINIP